MMAAHHTIYEPLPRERHAVVAVGSKLHMWGGNAGSDVKTREMTRSVEVFDITKELWERKRIMHGNPTPGLWNTAYTVVGTCLFVFGGYDGKSRYNSLYKLDLKIFQWKQVRFSTPSNGPQRKSGCRMVSYGENKLVVFAGDTDNGRTDELHIFKLDTEEWSSPAVTGTKPPALSNFSFTRVDRRRAVVYGGITNGPEAAGDAYVFELDNLHWSKLQTSGGPSPPARFHHVACSIAPPTEHDYPLLLVGGGVSGSGDVLKDMWVLDVDREVWSEVRLHKKMGPQSVHSAIVFGSGPNFRMVVLFGGVRTFFGCPIAATTLLHLEWNGVKWKVTKVKKPKPGRSAEKLREQMEKLQLDSSDMVLTRSEGTAERQ